ncbi:hypothetical protein GQR58_008696 [Nymphon striatum]|nr:hypothetical protein GQR58_008696 [Nymphon striatum]
MGADIRLLNDQVATEGFRAPRRVDRANSRIVTISSFRLLMNWRTTICPGIPLSSFDDDFLIKLRLVFLSAYILTNLTMSPRKYTHLPFLKIIWKRQPSVRRPPVLERPATFVGVRKELTSPVSMQTL